MPGVWHNGLPARADLAKSGGAARSELSKEAGRNAAKHAIALVKRAVQLSTAPSLPPTCTFASTRLFVLPTMNLKAASNHV